MSYPTDPFDRFAAVYAEASRADPAGCDAMCLATVGPEGRPSARIMLLKEYSRDGFVFYTNLASRKGHDLEAAPWAALTFYWPALMQQVRLEGRVSQVSDAEADAYFASRPRGSQIGAWASMQSADLDCRETLEARFAEVERQYEHAPVPRPPHWSGYRLVPDSIEFWIGLPSRLHDRTLFTREGGEWRTKILYP